MNVTHRQLQDAPELALLAALDDALGIAMRLLVAARPTQIAADTARQLVLPLPDIPVAARSTDPAICLLRAIDHLRDALAYYHAAVAGDPAPLAAVIPF